MKRDRAPVGVWVVKSIIIDLSQRGNSQRLTVSLWWKERIVAVMASAI